MRLTKPARYEEFRRKFAASLGIARSLLIYHGIPLRARRLRRFYAPWIGPGARCFDIGAHAGNHTRCWRRLGARVVAVEPQPAFVRILRLLFGRDPQVVILPVAVGAEETTTPLWISARAPTVSTLSSAWIANRREDASFQGVEWTRGPDVPVTTLDGLIRRYGAPDFVKIDVEGLEADVLAGLNTAVAALAFEFIPSARDVAIQCIDRLGELGRYEFNWSFGEQYRLQSSTWIDADPMRAMLSGLPPNGRSGDVYARLASRIESQPRTDTHG